MNVLRALSTTLSLALAPLGWPREPIPLAPADIERLGMAFAPVRSAATGQGPRFPATVISSPDSVSNFSAPYAGVIEAWLAAPGAEVRAGQALALIRSQEVLRLQQEWLEAVTRQESTRFELEKNERLFSDGVVSAQRVNQSRRDHEQAVFNEQAAAQSLRRVGFTPERLQAIRKQGEGLGSYHLLATSDGVLTRRHAATGDFVEAHTSLLSLRTSGVVWVSLQVPARVAAGLKPGQILRAMRSGEELVLRHKDHSIEGASQTLGILAEFKDETSYLPGQIIAVELPPPAEGIWVPAAAVVHRGDETTVFVRTASGVEARRVPLVPMGADYLAQGGLAEGEEVVVRGAAVLKGIQTGLGRPE